MPDLGPLYAAYLSLTFALVIMPGATTAVVVRNTLASGWRGGIWAAVGAAAGNSSHAVAGGSTACQAAALASIRSSGSLASRGRAVVRRARRAATTARHAEE